MPYAICISNGKNTILEYAHFFLMINNNKLPLLILITKWKFHYFNLIVDSKDYNNNNCNNEKSGKLGNEYIEIISQKS